MTGAALPDYSVAIPVRNEVNTLRSVVDAYLAQDHRPAEILICVNGATDGTDVLTHQLHFEHPETVVVLESDAAARKPGAWRTAFAAARTDHILFADGDTMPEPQNSRMLLEALVSHGSAVAAAPTIWVTRPTAPRSLFDRFSPDEFGPIVPPPTTWVQGAQYLLHRPRYRALAEALGVPLMPDVVSDDGYVNRVIHVSHGVTVGAPAAVVHIQPVSSLREYNLALHRFDRAHRQFREFPVLVPVDLPLSRYAGWSRARRLLAAGVRTRDILLVTKALGTLLYSQIYLRLKRYVAIARGVTEVPEDELWDLHTSKEPFTPDVVASWTREAG